MLQKNFKGKKNIKLKKKKKKKKEKEKVKQPTAREEKK